MNGKEFVYDMVTAQRPIVRVDKLLALIDTGATIPVVRLSPDVLVSAFQARIKYKDKIIGGLGSDIIDDVYTLKNLHVGPFTFKTCDFFSDYKSSQKESTDVFFLLSITMFNGISITFDRSNMYDQKIIYTVPDNEPLERKFELFEHDEHLCCNAPELINSEPSVSFGNGYLTDTVTIQKNRRLPENPVSDSTSKDNQSQYGD